MRFLAGLMAAGALSLAGAAWATPPGVSDKDGGWVAPDGKPLYTFARDMTPGKSACNGQCATAWPPRLSNENTTLPSAPRRSNWAKPGFPA